VVGGFKPTPKVSPSIESAQEKIIRERAEAEEQAKNRVVRNKPLAQAPLDAAVKQYAQSAAAQESAMLATILACPFLLQGEKVKITLSNSLQETQMPKLLPGIVKFLKDALENDALDVIYEVGEAVAPAAGTKLYTDDDKIRYLEEQYPAFRALREQLGLMPL
jgi:hypothetical protein